MKDKKSKKNNSRKDQLHSQISSEPSKEDFELSDREKELIQDLFSWSRQSKDRKWVLGEPV